MSSAFYSKKWHTDASETAKMRKSQESPCLSWKQGRAYFHWNCLHCAVGQELQLSHTNIQANCGMFLENPISFKNPNSWCTVVTVCGSHLWCRCFFQQRRGLWCEHTETRWPPTEMAGLGLQQTGGATDFLGRWVHLSRDPAEQNSSPHLW